MRTFLVLVLTIAGLGTASAQGVESVEDVTGGPKRATITLQTKVDDGPWTRKAAISPLATQSVSIKAAPIEGADVRWYLIFPDLTQHYENANPPWKPNPYKWVGFDTIDYHRIELTQHHGKWTISPFANEDDIWGPVRAWFKADKGQTIPKSLYQNKMGTFRFQAVATHGKRVWRSPGLQEIGDKGISPKVLRISLRSQDGYVGALSAFYNVPGIFGSVSYQSNHYIGVDCADLLVAAYGQWKRRPIKKNYNVSMLVSMLKSGGSTDLSGGVASTKLVWGVDIAAGDLIAVRYAGASRYQHIGALIDDTDGDGVLSAGDTVWHAGPHPMRAAPLSEGGFDGHVTILKTHKLR